MFLDEQQRGSGVSGKGLGLGQQSLFWALAMWPVPCALVVKWASDKL